MRIASIIGVVGAVALAACGGERADGHLATVEPAPSRRPVVVDIDAGLDDAVALLFLASSDEVDLRAVTVSGTGLAHCFPGARNVVGLLELAGRGDVPVACGPEEPVGADAVFHPFPDDWRRVADGRYGDAWRIGAGSLDDRPAPDLLVDTVRRSDRPLTLVTLGPLTNVAAALDLDENLTAGLERVVAMGGAFEVAGNTANAEPPPTRDVAEWNIYADPAAARRVVLAGLPLSFVPLDATNRVPLDVYVLRAVAAHAAASDAIGVVSSLLAGLHGLISSGDYYLWDPLAAVLTLRPELGILEQRTIDVVTSGAQAGRTIDTETGRGAEVSVFVAADGRAAEKVLLEGLAGEPVATIVEEPDLFIDPAACTVAGRSPRAGPNVLGLPDEPLGIAVGIVAPGRGAADIEAFFRTPTPEPPDWFTLTATLGGNFGLPSADLVRLAPATYTVVCIRGDGRDVELVGTTTFTVRP